jgi:diguanylate cyclase (GGDEF)-like protein
MCTLRLLFRRFWNGATALVLPILLFGATVPQARAHQVSFRTYGAAEGLTNAWFACLAQDTTGFIFTCTQHGLYAYDGRRFVNLGPRQGLPDGGIVEAMAIDSTRRIVLRYSRAIYVSTTPVSLSIPPERLTFQLAISTVGPLEDDGAGNVAAWDGGAVLAAQGHLYYVNTHPAAGPPVIERVGSRLRAQGIALQDPTPLAASGARLWLVTSGGGICEIGTQVRRCYGAGEGLPADSWEALLVKADGHVVARSMSHLAEIDPESGRVDVSVLPNQGGRYANYPHSLLLAQTPSGQLLTQSADGLIVRDGADWRAFTSDNGMPTAPILSVVFDHEGNLWIGAMGKGVMRALGYGVWDNLDHHDGLSNDVVWQMARQPGGPLWVATDGGVDALTTNTPFPTVHRHDDKPAFALATDAWGHVWRSDGSSGLSRITTATGEVQSFSTPAVNQILHGKGPLLWLITEKGVYVIRDSRVPHAPEPVAGLSGSLAGAVVDADGSLWMLKRGALLHRLEDGTLVKVTPHWEEAQFVPLILARAANGDFWVGGAAGCLYRLSMDGDHLRGMTRYDVPDIISTMVVSLFVDSRGWVWTGTDSGFSVFNGTRWVSANMNGGLIWNDLDQYSLFEDIDGSMWIGTSGGLSHLLDPTGLFKRQTLDPVITSVTIGDTNYVGQAFAFSRKPLEVRFGALNFEDDGTVRFRYRLKGVDDAWSEAPDGYVRYASIPPGRHAFEVIAYDPLTHQASAPVSVLLRMQQPWWAWWPMLILYAAGLCGLGYALLRLRIRLLLQQQRLLQDEVEHRTQEMREAQAALQILATQDSLTKLLTRGEIQARLVSSLVSEDDQSCITVGLMDIDHFKKINDRHGHLAGDEILEEMGRRLREALRPGEYAGRYGGEEILVVVISDEDCGLDRIMELNRRICGKPFDIDGQCIHVTLSVGVAPARTRDGWKSLIGRADKALYEAKENGRNRVIVATALSAPALR